LSPPPPSPLAPIKPANPGPPGKNWPLKRRETPWVWIIICNLQTLNVVIYTLHVSSDLASLAKAAVSGDEAALDLLSWKQGKVKMSLGPQESVCFFVGGTKGQ